MAPHPRQNCTILRCESVITNLKGGGLVCGFPAKGLLLGAVIPHTLEELYRELSYSAQSENNLE